MLSSSPDVRAEVADAVAQYQAHANVAQLLARLQEIAALAPTADALAEAAEPFQQIPEVAGPLYERIVAERPNDARALVVLASSYWLAGRGPEVVGDLASRAIAADPANRAAWHLWALTESAPRQRVSRWQQVCTRFPQDELAKANLADNLASLAGAEHDVVALKRAITAYEELLATAREPAQRQALETAVRTLKGWRL